MPCRRACENEHMHPSSHDEAAACCGRAPAPPASEPARDPVCGMSVQADSPHRHQHEGKQYLFCGAHCARKFATEPGRYLAPPSKPSAAETALTYTCPMHPEVRQVGPGVCPICGMALEPADASAAQDDSELRDMTRRFWISLALALPLLVLAMSDLAPHWKLQDHVGAQMLGWLEFALATPIVL